MKWRWAAWLLVWVFSGAATATAQPSPLPAFDAPPPVIPNATEQLQALASQHCEGIWSVPPGSRCAFARHSCTSESVVNYLELHFCWARPAGRTAAAVLATASTAWLLLLLRALGSTAERFFSPILVQLSQELGLPPRLAGVTLLALGNGAPDLSASVAAVRAGHLDFALGALLGGGMFVGCVAAGAVILTAGGASARGALLRDACAYITAALAVAAVLARGEAGYIAAAVLLSLYLVFVLIVLGADLWHLRYHGVAAAPLADSRQPLLGGSSPRAHVFAEPPVAELSVPPPRGSPGLDAGPRASTVELAMAQSEPWAPGLAPPASSLRARPPWERWPTGQTAAGPAVTPRAWPERLHTWPAAPSPAVLPAWEYRVAARAELAGGDGRDPGPAALAEGSSEAEGSAAEAGEASFIPVSPFVSPFSYQPAHEEGAASTGKSSPPSEVGAGPAPPPIGIAAAAASAAAAIAAALDAAEWPLLWARRLSIPVLDPGEWARPVFVAALGGAPPFAALYLGCTWQVLLAACGAGAVCASAAMASLAGCDAAKPPDWRCGTTLPLGAAAFALYGFALAAMWIDVVASEVVGLLEYLGVLSGVSHTVLGLTVLAWANCIGDMSTNLALARAGLPNMAMTACYAGPLFNLLVGLGLGFLRTLVATHQPVPVAMSSTTTLGVGFVCLMCSAVCVVGLLCGRKLPPRFGWVLLALYVIYLAANLALAMN